ncbi:MAG: hypothetical protein H0W72_09965 [Planctomycetes bacterium]|nr:hypothetical protein [Planctomycetota bacterium]
MRTSRLSADNDFIRIDIIDDDGKEFGRFDWPPPSLTICQDNARALATDLFNFYEAQRMRDAYAPMLKRVCQHFDLNIAAGWRPSSAPPKRR